MDTGKKLSLGGMTNRDDKDLTPINIINEGSNPINDEVANRAVEELFNLEKLETISRLKPEQVATITKLLLYSKTFNSPFCESLANHILQLQISINGYGRKEIVQLIQQRNESILLEKPATSKDIFR